MSATPLVNFRGHLGRVFSCCWGLRNSQFVYTSSEDQTVRCWNIKDQTATAPPQKITPKPPTSVSKTSSQTAGNKEHAKENEKISKLADENPINEKSISKSDTEQSNPPIAESKIEPKVESITTSKKKVAIYFSHYFTSYLVNKRPIRLTRGQSHF